MNDPDVTKIAKAFIDGALAARERLGYSARVSKKSYRRAVDQAAFVFEDLRAANGDQKALPTPPRKRS
jgi:hypothetical protein